MSGMSVRFWGTRGTIPTPGRLTEKYGGNTTCLEVRYRDTLLIFDAGSGIRALGAAWTQEFADRPVQAHLLLTHLHWDHIQGFPVFPAAYQKGNALTIHGEPRPDGGIRELLGGQMRGSYFPVRLEAMQADLTFRDTTPEFDIGPVRVRTTRLPHPGGCLGYRAEAGGATFVLATDCELDRLALNKEELRTHFDASRRYDPALVQFFRGANILVIDCQYTDDIYRQKAGWGHNSVTTVVDLCVQVRPDTLVLFHHDPDSTDEMVARMTEDVLARVERRGVTETLVMAARERLTMQVSKPLRPLSLAPVGESDFPFAR